MKFLISLGELRLLSEPKLVMQMLEQVGFFSVIDGIELKADLFDPLEVVRLNEYASLLKAKSKSIQLHVPKGFSNAYNDYDTISHCIGVYGRLAQLMNEKLTVVIHPVEHESVEKAQYRTMKLISKLNALKTIFQYDLEFTIENLVKPRLNQDELASIVGQSNFCWDIGHSVMNNKDYTLTPELSSRLTNVHIHDINGGDHHPFIYGKTDYIKAMAFLKSIHYSGAIVIEMKYSHLRGHDFSSKFLDYLNQVLVIKNTYDMLNKKDNLSVV